MDDKQTAIVALLEDLQRQLNSTPSLDPAVAGRIQLLIQEIEASLPGTAQEPIASAESPLTERLKEATLDFEASHPTLSRTVGNIADTLAQIGI